MFDSLRAWWSGSAQPAHGPTASEASLRRADGGPRRVAIFLDTSAESEYAFRWATANVIQKESDQCVHAYALFAAMRSSCARCLTLHARALRQRVPCHVCHASAVQRRARYWRRGGQPSRDAARGD